MADISSLAIVLLILLTKLSHVTVTAHIPDATVRTTPAAHRKVRTYYLGIDSVKWDYYPTHNQNRSLNAGSRGNLCTSSAFESDQLLFVGDGNVIDENGFAPTSVYEKIVFREYTDRTFNVLKKRRREERHLALLGPLLRVAAGETLVIFVRGLPNENTTNSDQTSFSLEIDGLFGGADDPLIAPGKIVEFRYKVDYRSAPATSSHVDSHMLLYRGTVGVGPDGSAGIYKGLLGGVIVYRRDHLDAGGQPKGVDTELVSILWVANENVGGEEGDVEESNLMHSINGIVYCALEGLDMIEGQVTRWYLGAVGNEVDVHTAHFHGIVGVNAGGAHVDSIRLLPGSTSVIELEPDNVGTWLFHCHINDHLHAGMAALFTVHDNGKRFISPISPTAIERVYYIQAEESLWDYAPHGRNTCDDEEFGDDELIFTQKGYAINVGEEFGDVSGFGIGSKYVKSRYIEYADATYTKRVKRDESMDHLGIMGPILRARVGEVIKIHFKNNASVPVSMHPHGVLYTKGNEGAPYNDGTNDSLKEDDVIQPGGSFIYTWLVPDRAGPGPGEREEVKLWMYHGHRNEITETYAGLFGPILVVSEHAAYDSKTLLPSDGSQEVFLHMSVMNEGGSYHLEENILRISGNRRLTPQQRDALQESDEFQESNLMHSINGFVYCNGPVVNLRQGKPTRFYFYALGTEVDLHTPMVGNEVLRLDTRSSRGTGALLPGTFQSARLKPRHTGLQELRCNVNDHVVAGMRALFFVRDVDRDDGISHVNVTHYIAADEVKWDYAALNEDGCSGELFGDDEKVFTEAGATTPGSRYIKAVYREYEDELFTTLKGGQKPTFSGVVGPLLHFEVEEVVRIVFKNNLGFSADINFVGLQLIWSSSASKVEPGNTTTYVFRVRREAGPSVSDLSSVPYVYYSSVDPIAHTAAGLTGVIAIARTGGLQKLTRLPTDTTEAYPLLLNIFRENESPLIEKSLSRFALEPRSITKEALANLSEDDDWLESNAMHSINGYLYGNNPEISLRQGSTVRFYAFGYGSEASMHVPIWKGQVMKRGVRRGNKADGVQIFPFNAETVDVHMERKGTWPVVCGVADHVLGGMKVCVKVT